MCEGPALTLSLSLALSLSLSLSISLALLILFLLLSHVDMCAHTHLEFCVCPLTLGASDLWWFLMMASPTVQRMPVLSPESPT